MPDGIEHTTACAPSIERSNCSRRADHLRYTTINGGMSFSLDYDKMIFLDAEHLAEAGIKDAYDSLLDEFKRFVPEPAAIQELVDPDAPRYSVLFRGLEYVIYSSEIPSDHSWGRATYTLFKIVNDQLMNSEYRLYAVNGGNDLGGFFLTAAECDEARRSLSRNEDWPYLPALEDPWYGQPHG
jgi:hypothetical protein